MGTRAARHPEPRVLNGDRRPSALSRLELAAGSAIGLEPSALNLPCDVKQSEREAIEAALLPALLRPPCAVSFSGGLDSSLILAVAVDVARRQQLEDPVPVTLRFAGIQSADETEWQEMVVSHLGLGNWETIAIDDELDFLGPIAQRALSKYGLLWPANVHFHVPVLARAAGGSLLTGIDGDGLFGGWRWQRARSAQLHRSRRPRDGVRIALALAPAPVRAAGLFGRTPMYSEWLRPAARWRLRWILAQLAASEPNRWSERVNWYARQRHLKLGVASLEVLARDHDVQVVHPLLDRVFLAAVAAAGGRAGYGSRRAAMRKLFSDVLPSALFERRTKGEFGAAMWRESALAFARRWDASGLDAELIDVDALKSTWQEDNPPLAAATLLQAAWLAGKTATR